MIRLAAALLIPASLLIAGCASGDAQVSTSSGTVSDAGTEPTLGVPVGTRTADATLYDQSGNPVRLSSLYENGPVIVTFYRGNWCPFCNDALKDWQGQLDTVAAEGATFVALTPERPSETAATIAKNGLSYRVFSDANREAANAFNVNFALASSTVSKYKGYGIDLAQTNADAQWELPHPGTFIIDQSGTVRYAHVDENYRAAGRAEPSEVIAALRAL